MFFDNDDARKNYKSSKSAVSKEELEQANNDFNTARMLMEAITQKGSHSHEDFDRMDELQKEMETALLVIEKDKDEKLQHLFGSAYEVFMRTKRLAAEGDLGGIEAWKQLKPLYDQMLGLWIQGRGES